MICIEKRFIYSEIKHLFYAIRMIIIFHLLSEYFFKRGLLNK